jgi:type VI secretion system protein ImpK
MSNDAQVRSKFIQIGLYSAALIAGLVSLSLLLPWLFALLQPPAPPQPQPVSVQRVVAPPPPAPRIGQLERIRGALDAEIRAGSISVDPFGGWIAIRVGNLITFNSGQAAVLPGFIPVARRIAEIVEGEKGPIRIVGHTDDQALGAGGPYRDNQALSVARAEAVAGLLRSALTDGGRIATDGRGASEPIADNASADGRARNRRVEVLVTRAE